MLLVAYVVGAVVTVAVDRWSSGTLRGDWSTSLIFGALWPLTWVLALWQGSLDRAARHAAVEVSASCGDLAAFLSGGLSYGRHRAFCEHVRSCGSCRRGLAAYADGEAGLSDGADGAEEHSSSTRRSARRSNS